MSTTADKKVSLDSPISVLSGVGPAKEKQLNALGIFRLRDLLYHFPRAYENRGDVRLLRDGIDGEKHAFLLTVSTIPKSVMIRRGMTITKFRAFDESGSIDVVYYNQNYLQNAFIFGEEYRFYGRLQESRRVYQLVSPAFEKVPENGDLPPFVPVYSLTQNLSSKALSKWIEATLQLLLPTLTDYLPAAVRERNGLPTLAYALSRIHNPDNAEELNRALSRLIFDEYLCFALAMKIAEPKRKEPTAIAVQRPDLDPFLSRLPFRLTDGQSRAVSEILGDMCRPAVNGRNLPMSRILIGDVGCGKTVCAEIALYAAVKSGHRAAMMVPTEILARQHYSDISGIFSELGFHVELLVGSTPAKKKNEIYASLSSESGNRCDIVIGTHALLNDNLDFSDLALVITDEQHRFGVMQRAALSEKGNGCHLLVMSATPIPRTLALTLYGNLDVSKIDEMPSGRQRVDTFVVDTSYRPRLHAFIRKEVQNGGQVYIVCPAVYQPTDEEKDVIPLEEMFGETRSMPPLCSAVALAEQLKTEVFPEFRVAFLHGKMKPSEKDTVMRDFADGQIDILVSTTVIEVGVNVPNASVMIVENAERFGLSQLHQLRGRVGRGSRKSYCILLSDADEENAKRRLLAMKTTYDGYHIAEKDLEIRGPGDFFASAGAFRQSGGLPLRLSRLSADGKWMEKAFAEAKTLTDADQNLLSPDNIALRNAVLSEYDLQENTIS